MVRMLLVYSLFLLLSGCRDTRTSDSQTPDDQRDSTRINDKCIALLAYGLLSDDAEDVPLGGGCKEFISDSLVNYLIEQKHVYKMWKQTGVIDSIGINNGKKMKGDLRLLSDLINNRIQVEKSRGKGKGWDINAYAIIERYGKDYSFIWKNLILGLTLRNTTEPIDSLTSIKTFNEFSLHLDAFLPPTSQWCREVTDAVTEYKKYSRRDFFLDYYSNRCLSPSQSQ